MIGKQAFWKLKERFGIMKDLVDVSLQTMSRGAIEVDGCVEIEFEFAKMKIVHVHRFHIVPGFGRYFCSW